MDRAIQKKFWTINNILSIIGIALLLLFIIYNYINANGASKLNVQSDRLMISEIKKGNFKEFIPINGVVNPIQTIYLDAIEGGRVEALYIEDGGIVSKGQPLLKLANTDLELSLSNQETSVFQLITQMQYTRNLARENTIRLEANLADIDNNLAEAKRLYDLNSKLFKEKVLSEQEYLSSMNIYNYNQRRKKLIEKTLSQDSITSNEQLKQMQETINRTKQTLALMRKKAGDLIVTAPVSGQLTSRNAEVGETKSAGQRLGQIDVMSGFKIKAEIDEHYINRVFIGLNADFITVGKTFQLVVKKVYSQVTNGRFQVDLEFIGATPKNIRRGQTMQTRLFLGDESQALLLPKGGFFQQTGGNWIFKVSESGLKAFKVDIELGRQNPEYYEVLQGLKSGDKVVTSSYENFGDMEELVIK
jgi:HlyD family secretion protein